MIVPVIRHELRTLLRDRALVGAWAIFVAALCVALVTGTGALRGARDTEASVHRAHDEHLSRMRAQLQAVADGRTPEGFFVANRAASLRHLVARPVSPLTPLALGEIELLPASGTVGLFTDEATMFDVASIANPSHLHIGRFDVTFVIVSLLPLLAIGLSFNLLSAERERGTLAMLMTQPLSTGRLLLAKAIVPWGVLAAPAVVIPIAWTIVVSPASATHVPQLVAYGAVVALYAAFWIALAAAVNLAGRRSATNAIVLGASWLLLVQVVPTVLGAVTSTVYPVPSRMAMVSQARLAEVEATQRRDEVIDRFYRDHPELMPPDGAGAPNRTLAAFAAAREAARVVDPVYRHFEQQLAARHRVVRAFQFMSPAIVAREALTGLAGTNRAAFTAFRDDVRAFRERVETYLLPIVASGRQLSLPDYANAPSPGNPGPVLAIPWAGIAGLLLPFAALVAWVARRSRAYERVTGA